MSRGHPLTVSSSAGRKLTHEETVPSTRSSSTPTAVSSAPSTAHSSAADDDRPDPTSTSLVTVIVPPGTGTALDFLSVSHVLTSRDTGGGYYLFHSGFEPGAGNRLHVHRREDEVGFVLAGSLEIRLPDRTVVLEAGGAAHLPRTIPHAIRNPLATPSRYLFIAVPGGMDRWFDALAIAHAGGTLDDEAYRRSADEYGIEWLE